MRLLAFAVAATAALSIAIPANAAKLDKPTITTRVEGTDLHVTVHAVTDYCETDADTQILRTSDTIRILRERPHDVSRCIQTRDLNFVVKDVTPGRYAVTYERMPLLAPRRPIRVAWTTAVVR